MKTKVKGIQKIIKGYYNITDKNGSLKKEYHEVVKSEDGTYAGIDKEFYSNYPPDEIVDDKGNKDGTFGYIFANGNRHQRRKARKELELRIKKDLINNNKKYGEKKVESDSELRSAKIRGLEAGEVQPKNNDGEPTRPVGKKH